jgi:hypothetical protein
MNKVLVLLNMESGYHIVTICVNETLWAHVWRLHSRYLGTGYDIVDSKIIILDKLQPSPLPKVQVRLRENVLLTLVIRI